MFSVHPTSGNALIIQIDEVIEENKTLKWSAHSRKLYQGTLLPLCSESERHVLKMLMDEQIKYLKEFARRESVESIDFSKIHIDWKRAIFFLKELAATGRLFFKRKEIVANFFGGAELEYHIDAQDAEQAFLKIIVKTSSREFNISECDLLARGSPNWFLKGNFLLMFKESLSWKWLRKIEEGENLSLSKKECVDLLEELKEEQEMGAPRFIVHGKEVKAITPMPIIALTDRTGAFANLLMDYGEGQKIRIDVPMEKWRNREAEVSFKKDFLEGGFQEKKIGPSCYYCPVDKVKETLQFFIEMGWRVFDSNNNLVKHDLSNLKDCVALKKLSAMDEDLNALKNAFKGFEGFRKVTPGSAFKGTLRGYQEEGLSWLAFLYENKLHGILADDMGLGKTVQVLSFLSMLSLKSPVLIVMPTSLLFNWNLEFQKFLPSFSVCMHHGNERKEEEESFQNYDVILTSYAILRRDLSLFQKIHFSCAFIDEAQGIKNVETQSAIAVSSLRADFRLSITGTPIENHLGELLSQFKFLMPHLYKLMNEEYGKLKTLEPEVFRKIKRQVRPFILRRRKHDVDEQLPEKIEQTIWLEMPLEQRKIYDVFYLQLKDGLLKNLSAENLNKHRMEIFEAILRLRQICCHPQIAISVLEGVCVKNSAKSDALFTDLEILLAEGQKAIVFSQFTSMLKLIAEKCAERGWSFSYLDGATKDRQSVVRRFQEDKTNQLFLISLKAGGVGLNLTAADYVILYEPWWNEAVENQAIDRVHRIGRLHPVIAKRYIFRDTIEERMMLLKETKRAIASSLFETEAGFSIDDLEFLLCL